MKIVVSGTRFGAKNLDCLKHVLLEVAGTHKDVHLIHGGCQGIDTQCLLIAKHQDWKTTTVKPDWKRYKLKAGPIRNREMIEKYEPDYIICFPHKTHASRGTQSTIKFAKAWIATHSACVLIVEPVD